MRMWMINPEILCQKHLLGEHGEIHKFRPSFVKKFKIDGRVQPGNVQIEPASMQMRHHELATEMLQRGMNHQSPYEQPDLSYLPKEQQEAKVDHGQALEDLIYRCPECRDRYYDYIGKINKELFNE